MPIEIKNLSYVYSPKTPFRHTALSDITLTINDGDFLGIIGHTGSGKSTLIQHLNGLIKLTEGEITVNGIDLSGKYDYKKLRSTVGMVFQYPEYQLFDETVEKDVAFGPKNLGFSPDDLSKAVREAIETVGLNFEEVRGRSPFDLSGGQKRRAALAGVLAMRPKILVLDEPTAGIDPKGKSEIISLIRGLHDDNGITIVFVSHNMDEIAENCDRVAVLNEGKLVYDLPPAELFQKEEELKALNLDIPAVQKIKNLMRKKGVELPENIIKKAELEKALLALCKRKI